MYHVPIRAYRPFSKMRETIMMEYTEENIHYDYGGTTVTKGRMYRV